jgi:hypothetical protein
MRTEKAILQQKAIRMLGKWENRSTLWATIMPEDETLREPSE